MPKIKSDIACLCAIRAPKILDCINVLILMSARNMRHGFNFNKKRTF